MFAFDKRRSPWTRRSTSGPPVRRSGRLRVGGRFRDTPARARASPPRRGARRGAGKQAPRGARLHRLIVAHDLLARAFDLLLGPLDRWSRRRGCGRSRPLSGVACSWSFAGPRTRLAIRATRRRAQAELLAVRLYGRTPGRAAGASEVSRRHRALSRADAGPVRVRWRYPSPCSPRSSTPATARARSSLGERAVVEAFGASAMLDSASNSRAAEGIVIEDGAGAHPRARRDELAHPAKAPGRQSVTLLAAGGRVDKEVSSSPPLEGLRPPHVRRRLRASSSPPPKPRSETASAVRRIEVLYPPLEIDFLGWKTAMDHGSSLVSSTVALALRRRVGSGVLEPAEKATARSRGSSASPRRPRRRRSVRPALGSP